MATVQSRKSVLRKAMSAALRRLSSVEIQSQCGDESERSYATSSLQQVWTHGLNNLHSSRSH
jgi:hypothetical protein